MKINLIIENMDAPNFLTQMQPVLGLYLHPPPSIYPQSIHIQPTMLN